jgi:hypothetical protein
MKEMTALNKRMGNKRTEGIMGTETASAVLSVAIERGADEHQPQSKTLT